MRYCIFLTVWIAIVCVGCASYYTLPKDIARAAHNRINCQEKNDLSIAAEGYQNSDKCLRYFKRDLLELGYIPVYISVSNRSQEEYTLRRENIIFQFEDGMETTMAPVGEVIQSAYFSQTPSYCAMLFGILPGVFLWYKTDWANDRLDQDYSQKALRDVHICPNDSISGFIFFRIPSEMVGKTNEKLIRDGSIELIVHKKARGDQMAEVLNYVLSIEDTTAKK